ncbi:uncharacterized protein LOC144060408 [Vanacampus margaritifer]
MSQLDSLGTALPLRGAFSDTEDFLDHGMVSAKRCSSRTSSVSSWTENMKPSFTKKIKFQSVLEGEPVVFKCKLVACPPPTILWFHNNRSVPKAHRRRICTESAMHIHTSSLLIDSIRERDSGSYKVMAINTEGSAESTASLLVSLREEQSANYLSFVRRSGEVHESMASMAEQRKGRKIRVDLRYVGSPFDKMSKVHQRRSRSKTTLMRTVFFHSSYWHKKDSSKESKCLETASERAPSPQPMFNRSDRFNDRFSDVYCDRRTGTRFSDNFSDRCSDRNSERFSDTESLHNEVRTKLSTLQKAVRQRKRLSVSTVSSCEFESESVASDLSYADYVERLRMKPVPLPNVQHFKRAFDEGEVPRERQGPEVSKETTQPHVRHAFEPQSRSRAIQIMRGELVDVVLPQCQTRTEEYADTLQQTNSGGFDGVKEEISELHIKVGDYKVECLTEEVDPYLPDTAPKHSQFPYQPEARSCHEPPHQPESPYLPKIPLHHESTYHKKAPHHPEPTIRHDPPHYPHSTEYQGHLHRPETTYLHETQYRHEPPYLPTTPQLPDPRDSKPLAYEEPCMYTAIRESAVTERAKEDLSLPQSQNFNLVGSVLYHVSPEGWDHTATTTGNEPLFEVPYQGLDRKYLEHETKVRSLQIRKGRTMSEDKAVESETGISKPREPPYTELKEHIYTHQEERQGTPLEPVAMFHLHKCPGQKAQETDPEAATVSTGKLPELEVRAKEVVIKELFTRPQTSPQVNVQTEADLKTKGRGPAAKIVEPAQDKYAAESRYEQRLKTEHVECEEKLLALRIGKGQQVMQIRQKEPSQPESGLPKPEEILYTFPQVHIYSQSDVRVVTPGETEGISHFHKSTRMKAKETDPTTAALSTQEVSEIDIRPEEREDDGLFMHPQVWPEVKAQTEQRFKTKAREKALKRVEAGENKWCGESLREQYVRSLEAERIDCEEKLLALRIRKWQQGMAQEEISQPETGLTMPKESAYIKPEDATFEFETALPMTLYMEPEGHFYTQHEAAPEETVSCLNKSPRMKTKETDTETATLSTHKLPEVMAEETDDDRMFMRQQMPSRVKVHTEAHLKTKAREETAKRIESAEDKWPGVSLREQYEKSLEAECDEKLLALQVSKWQQGTQMIQEDTSQEETAHMEPEEHISTQRRVCAVTREDLSPCFHTSARMKPMETNFEVEGGAQKIDDEGLLVQPQTPSRVKVQTEASHKTKGSGDARKRVAPASNKSSGVSLREQHEKNLEADRIEREDKLALGIRKVQQGTQMTQEETCQTETELLMPEEMPYMESEEHISDQQDMIEVTPEEPEVMSPCFRKPPRMKAKETRREAATVSTYKLPNFRAEEKEDNGLSAWPQMPHQFKQTEEGSKIKGRGEATKMVESADGKRSGECLREQYEKNLEVDPSEYQGKHVGPLIRKCQQGMTQEEPSQPANVPSKPEEIPDMESGGPVCTENKRDPYRASLNQPQPVAVITQKSTGAETQRERDQTLPPALKARGKRQGRGLETLSALHKQMEFPSKTKGGDEKFLFEKTNEEQELQLSVENISELKKCEQFESEEQALAQRIMKWQQDVLMEQGEVIKPVPPTQAERSTEVEKRVTEMIAPEPLLPHGTVHNKTSAYERTSKEKFFMSHLGPNQQGVGHLWSPADVLPTEGRETGLQRDSEYLVSEDTAQAQQLFKWPTDVVEPEKVPDLESDLAFVSPAKSFSNDISPPHMEAVGRPSHIFGEKSQEEHLVRHHADSEQSPPLGLALPQHSLIPKQVESMSETKEDAGDASSFQRYFPSQPTNVSPVNSGISSQLRSPREESSARGCSPLHGLQTSESDQRLSKEDYSSSTSSSQPIQEELKEERTMGMSVENSEKKPHTDLLDVEKVEISKEFPTVKDENRQNMSQHGAVAKVERRSQEQDVSVGANPTPTSMMLKEPSAHSCRPIFVNQVSSLQVRVGQMSELSCQFQGDPLPQVTWLKDGHPLAHDPDYDITVKYNKSTLTIFYPTTDHEGTYSCAISNKHGKSICSANLKIVSQEEAIAEEFERGEEPHDSRGEACSETNAQPVSLEYLNTANVGHSSPVEIRVDAPTPDSATMEECGEDQPQDCLESVSDLSQTGQHKFTFSFDALAESPRVVKELENLSCPEGQTAMLTCVLTAEPSLEVTWFYNDIPLETTAAKYREEVDGQVYKLYISSFTQTDAGMYKCVAKNKMGKVSCTCDVFCQDVKLVEITEDKVGMETNKKYPLPQVPPKSRSGGHREPPLVSGCGLQQSAAVIKVSQIKQAFESDSAMAPASSQKQREEPLFPVEFIPAVSSPCDELKDHPATLEHGSVLTDPFVATNLPCRSLTTPLARSSDSAASMENVSETSAIVPIIEGVAVKQLVEGVRESSELNWLIPQKPDGFAEPLMAGQVGVAEGEEKELHMLDKTSSSIPFQSNKVPTIRHSVKTSDPTSQAQKPQGLSEPLKSEKQREVLKSDGVPEGQGYTVKEQSTDVVRELKQEVKKGNGMPFAEESLSLPEPSLDSGVFFSGPASQVSAMPTVHLIAGDVAGFEKGDERFNVAENLESLIGQSNVRGPEHVTSQSHDPRNSQGGEAGRTAVGVMEEEEVTFGAVYEYYNPPTDWGRPLSPESEISIEIGSTVSEEVGEVADSFYTPTSSAGVSQPTFHTPKSPSSFHTPNSPSSFRTPNSPSSFHTPNSPSSFHTPISDTPGGFNTPLEYPSSPTQKRPPSDSSDRFFSPVEFLMPSADEGLPAEVNVDEQWFLSRSRGSLGLPSHQEKLHGIPPAFLKPLTKKRLFENESLIFLAEVFGLPSPVVKWFCNKTRLVADKRIIMERDGDGISLTIHHVTKADQGEYICQAVNDVGEARSVAFVVVVSQEMRLTHAPPAVTHQHVMEFDVEKDDSSRSPSPQEILLEVELDENEVKEFEKQVKIITIPEYTADSKSMIISLDVIPSIYEEGTVDFVTQEHENLKIAFEVTEMPPRFINPICDVETAQGSTVMFECSLMGIPSPVVSWFKGAQKIPHNNRRYLHSSDGDNHFLKICKVTVQDGGIYACSAVNVVGETLCRASLVVLSTKEFSGQTRGRELTAVSLGSAKVQPQKFDLLVGNSTEDSEQVSQIELEFEFQQEADESQRAVRLVANTEGGISKDRYMSINFDVFAESAKEDKVEFKGKSSDMCSFEFQVTEMAPRCVIPLTDVTAAVGAPVILQCLVNGKPKPLAEWYKDGERVTDGRYIIQEKTAGHFNLLITNASQGDAGEYRCLIQNAAGWIETSALLKVF